MQPSRHLDKHKGALKMQEISSLKQEIQEKIKAYDEEFKDLFELFEKIVYKSDFELFSALLSEVKISICKTTMDGLFFI